MALGEGHEGWTTNIDKRYLSSPQRSKNGEHNLPLTPKLTQDFFSFSVRGLVLFLESKGGLNWYGRQACVSFFYNMAEWSEGGINDCGGCPGGTYASSFAKRRATVDKSWCWASIFEISTLANFCVLLHRDTQSVVDESLRGKMTHRRLYLTDRALKSAIYAILQELAGQRSIHWNGIANPTSVDSHPRRVEASSFKSYRHHLDQEYVLSTADHPHWNKTCPFLPFPLLPLLGAASSTAGAAVSEEDPPHALAAATLCELFLITPRPV